MKLAFVSTVFGYPLGGADTLWVHAAEAAAARGDALLLLIPATTAAHPRIDALVRQGARLVVRPDPSQPRPWSRRLWNRLRRSPAVEVAALAAFAPDLVVVSGGATYDLAFEPALLDWLRTTGTRHRIVANFQFENPTLDEPLRGRARAALLGAERLFFVSHRNLASTRRHLGDDLARAAVLQNPLRSVPPQALPWPASPPWRFAALARLEGVKGLPPLLHAFADRLRAEPDWTLSIFGRGPQQAELAETARRLGLAERVTLRGFEPDLARIWSEHHLLVSPALEEGVPMTIPEAMLHGRPVLATRVGGAEDWIEDGANGWICPAPTVELLGETLVRAWRDRARWAELGTAARRTAGARYRADDHLQLIA